MTLCAFDLIELDGQDLRKQPIEERKEALARLLCWPRDGTVFNEHFEGDGAIILRQACTLGCEGIVSKRRGSLYRAGRTALLVGNQKPGRTGGEARGGRGLRPLS